MKAEQRVASWMMVGLITVAILNNGCGSTMHRGQGLAVRPGPYPGVRTDLRTIGHLPDAVKTARGGDKVVAAACIPFSAALYVADIPLSATVDSIFLLGDIKAAEAPHQAQQAR